MRDASKYKPETNFDVFVVSDEFKGKNLLARHRLINDLFQDEFDQKFHSLSLILHTTDEANEKKDEKLKQFIQDSKKQDELLENNVKKQTVQF